MRVDIWSDVVCPWCYIGKARFEKALSEFGHAGEVEVTFRSFELDPSSPVDRHESVLSMLSQKYGMPLAEAQQAEGRVAGLARAEGLSYQSERPVGNTFDLHRLLQLGKDKGVQSELLTKLYGAYFAGGRQVFDPEVSTEIAIQAGLDRQDVAKVLETDEYADVVRADEEQARELGITGVPFFVFDMALGVSGAQSTETFTEVLAQAWDGAGRG